MERVRDAGRVSHRLNLLRNGFGARALLARIKRRTHSRAQTAHALGVFVDALENRTLLSTLPAPVTTFDTSIAGLNTSGNTNYSSPSIAYNPLNPLEVVEASVEDAPSTSGDQKVFIQLSYSKDGGATWSSQGVASNLVDPVATTPQLTHFYTAATDPTVAFDRLGNFYLSFSEHTGDTQGEIVVDSYSFTGNAPVSTLSNGPVYGWVSQAGQFGEALHPTMAVDDNVQSYTAGGVTLTDPMIPTSGNFPGQGPIYIAWATNYLPPSPPPGWNPNAILMSESSDAGATFGAPVYLNSGGNFGSERETYPKLTISQGTLAKTGGQPTVEPGQVTAVWDDFGTGSTAGPPFDVIDSTHDLVTAGSPALEVGTNVVTSASPVPIADATGATTPYTPSITDVTFNLDVPSNFTLSDMQVELGISAPDVSEYQIKLIAPNNAASLILIKNGKDANGQATGSPAPGAQGTGIGVEPNIGANGVFGTDLTDGARSIESGTSPYGGEYSADGGSFVGKFGGLTPAQLSGTWTLEITDFVADQNPTIAPQLQDFKVSLEGINIANQNTIGSTFVTGSLNGPFNAPGDYPSSPFIGIGPAPVIASDNTLGDFSQFEGRIYVSYVDKASNATSNTDIALAYSSNGGVSWTTASQKVNDDQAIVDGYSGDNGGINDRSQFEPSVAVDQANGTLVLTWYDARYDAADARVARFITTSLDGGKSFGAQTYLNLPNQVYDAISGQADNLGPIPDNFSGDANGLISLGSSGFYEGTQQGLTVFDGRVYSAWTGNLNEGPQGNLRLGILTSSTTYSSGPRVISSTQGVVSTPEDIVNPAQNLGGTTGIQPAFQYIDVSFDRPIDPSTFTPSDVDIQYRDNGTPGTQPPTSDISQDIGTIIPLNLQFWNGALSEAATEFRIALTTPQTLVGTYSYFISPSVSDGYEYYGLSGTTTAALTASALDPTQANVVVPALGSSNASSKIVVPAGTPGVNQTIVDVQVNVEFNGANDAAFYQLLQQIGSEYNLTLSDGTTNVPLAIAELGASQGAASTQLLPDLAGHGYVSTTFDDESPESIFDGNFQFSGTFEPEGNLASFNGTKLTSGSTWTLSITSTHANSGSVPTGLLRDWSIQFQTETLQTNDANPPINGNTMDQNGDAIPGQVPSFTSGFQTTGDVWAMPTPSASDSYASGSPNYFTAPFVSGTSAIIVPGPSIAQYIEYPATVNGGVSIPSSGTVTSTITIGGASYEKITDLIVKLQITYPKDNDLVVTLISPAGTPVTLIAEPPVTNATAANPALSDANFGDSANFGTYQYLGPTVFTDDALNALGGVTSKAPYIGLYAPASALSNLDGESLAGTWTLQIQNLGGSSTGVLNAWSITASTQTAPTDTSINQIAVRFDRNMDPSTITNADVLSITGPLGLVPGNYTITRAPGYDPNNPDPDSNNPRTYLIGFASQTLTGTYTVNLADTIESAPFTANGIANPSVPLDTDKNAGVNLLNDTGGTVTKPYAGSGGSLPARFTSNGVFTSTLNVPISDANLISKISITLKINTSRGPASDLSAVLIAPNGMTVQLFSNLASNTSFNGLDTTFEDISTISINSASSGYNGTYTSQQPLSSLLDSNSAGTWTLVIKNVGANTYTLNNWSMSVTTASPNSGTGATVADQATTSFQLFNLGAQDDQSHEVWTPVGGTVNTGSNSAAGPVTAIGVDPSDPSGNTVYIGAATGGVWKTTDFLTTSPNGPTYIPLIANAPTNGLNIGSIAVLGSQVDPSTITQANPQGTTDLSMVFAATGNGNTNTLSPGIGILVSLDGGSSWNLATGLTNTNSSGAWVSTSSSARDNTFVGLIAYKIVVDPRLQANGDAILYVAFTDPTGNGKGGIYRSVDSGKTWTLMRAGQATDVVLDLNSAIPSFNNSDVNNPTDNVNAIDAAFANDGVYRSPNRGVTWNELLGTDADPNILDYSAGNGPPVKVANLPTPNGDFGRIVLATPSLTGNPTQDALYEGWLYAAVVSENNLNNPDGTLVGLYMTKDFGQSWTKVQVDGKIINGTISQNPTNDTTQDPYDVTNGPGIGGGVGNYAIAISVDPNDPNVVYLASSAYANHAAGMVRVDTTGISDTHAFYAGENAPDGGQIRADTTDVVALKNWYNTSSASVGMNLTSITEPTINLLQNPSEPFSEGSAVPTNNVSDVSNSGANITWVPFDSAFDYSNATTTQSLYAVTTTSEYHQIVSEIDPQTGLSRLIVATDQGVYSAVDDKGVFLEYTTIQNGVPVAKSSANEQLPSGALQTVRGPNGPVVLTLGLNAPITGSRNGNLQIAELYYGAVQPSQGAANASGALFYGEGQGIGLVSSSSNILSDGNIAWTSTQVPSSGAGVATDQTGTGTVYNYANPFLSGTATDFFQVNGTGRTTGLLTTGADNAVSSHDAEWTDFVDSGNLQEGTFANNQSSNSTFAVNPINGSEIVISSHPSGDAGAQIFATQNQGVNWSLIGTSNDLDDSYAPALAYGAPATNVAEGNFIYAGTDAGHIYVTFTGGGNGSSNGNPWINISSGLDGSPVESIITDPNHNTFDAFAVTQKGVYFMADSSAASPSWVKITSNLLNITQTAFNNSNYVQNAVQMLTSMVADWRYATPVLYVGANAGVYRGVKNGSTWTWSAFPDASDGAAQDGGYLPNVEVSDLDLAVGNVDPTSGLPVTKGNDPDSLVASTFGDGAYAIRLAPVISNAVLAPMSDTGTSSTDDYTKDQILTFSGNSEKLITNFNSAHIGIYLINSDGSTTYLGGFDGTLGDASDTLANQTDPSGNFSVTTTVPLPANGTFTIGLRATDNAGVTGAFTKINVTIATTPPTINTFTLTAATDSGTTVGGVYHTNVNPPAVQGTVINESAPTQSEQGTIVSIYLDSNLTTPIGTAVVDANNDFTFTLPAALSQGNHTITAIATDPVGNVSASTSLTVDIITSIATPSAPTLATASDSGVSNSDDLTKVTQPTFTGTAAAGDTVTLLINGNTTTDTAVADTNGNYSITVPSSLGADGTYAITVTQTDLADNVSAASPVLDVVLDTTNPVVAATAATAHQYGTFTGTVGTITDLHADGTATINWGDGQSSAATLVATSNPNVYDIQGTHVYQSTGSFSISITASDAAGNSASTSTSGSVTVTPPAPVVTAINVSANEGQVLTSIPVASFTNGAPSPTANEFSATINWGDGSTATTGSIVPDPNHAGSFLVEGSHTYTDGPNSYTITITVNATGVANPSTGTGTATIANVAPAVTLGGNATGFINQIITLPITAIDPSGPDAAAGFAYVINWGDGNSQTIAAAANNGTGQAPTHVYSTAGNYTITVTATDKDGGVGTATKALQIAVAPTLSNVVINNGEAQRSHIDTVSFTLTSPSVPITSLDTSEMALVFDGSTIVPLTNATVTYNAATGQASVNLTGVTLANGDYQLFVFPGTGVLPINFTKLTGDTNGDGFVTKTDVNTAKADLGAHSGQSNYNVNADINGDGVVNSTDQSLLRLDKKAKLTTKVIKLLAGKVIKPVNLSFAAIATNATRALPIVLELQNADPSRPLTISGVSLLGGGSNFSFAVLNQPYGASSFTIPAGGTLTIRMYFTPSGPGKFSTQLKAELSNDVQATYGAVIAKFKAAATAPKKS